MMKVTKRDIILLVTLISVVAGYTIYQYIYTPHIDEMARLENELNLIRQERLSVETRISSIPRLESEIHTAEYAARENGSLFFGEIIQENLIVLLDSLARTAPIAVTNYSYDVMEAVTVPVIRKSQDALQYDLKQLVDNYLMEHGSLEQRLEILLKDIAGEGSHVYESSNQLAKASITMAVNCTYSELMSFLALLEGYDKSIVVRDIRVNAENDGLLNITMTTEFYVLPKLFQSESDEDFLQWVLSSPTGKDQPFSHGGTNSTQQNAAQQNINQQNTAQQNANQQNTAQQNANQQSPAQSGADGFWNGAAGTGSEAEEINIGLNDPDFFIIARSVTSDMPTMTIGMGSDEAGETYIRETSDGEQRVTVDITQEGGIYYYSYTTDNNRYPPEGRSAFVPYRSGVINFIVYSRQRSSERDTNSVNLTVNNTSGLELNLVVSGDDSERPRVFVTTP